MTASDASTRIRLRGPARMALLADAASPEDIGPAGFDAVYFTRGRAGTCSMTALDSYKQDSRIAPCLSLPESMPIWRIVCWNDRMSNDGGNVGFQEMTGPVRRVDRIDREIA